MAGDATSMARLRASGLRTSGVRGVEMGPRRQFPPHRALRHRVVQEIATTTIFVMAGCCERGEERAAGLGTGLGCVIASGMTRPRGRLRGSVLSESGLWQGSDAEAEGMHGWFKQGVRSGAMDGSLEDDGLELLRRRELSNNWVLPCFEGPAGGI